MLVIRNRSKIKGLFSSQKTIIHSEDQNIKQNPVNKIDQPNSSQSAQPLKPQLKNLATYIVSIGIIVLISAIFILAYRYIGRSNQSPELIDGATPTISLLKVTQTPSPIELRQHIPLTTTMLSTKNGLIQSQNLDDVTRAIALGYIPESQISSKIRRSYDSLSLPTFRVTLTQTEYDKLNQLLSSAGIAISSQEAITVDNDTWKGRPYAQDNTLFTKNGFMCYLTHPIGPPWNSIPAFECIKLHYLTENNLTQVGTFIKATLTEAGISCSQNCIIEQTTNQWPLYKYGRDLVYWEKNIYQDDQALMLELVYRQASESAEFLRTANWHVVAQDYTDSERGWDKTALVSMLIQAKNDLFSCSHTITLHNLGLRQMIGCIYNEDKLVEVQSYYDPYQ